MKATLNPSFTTKEFKSWHTKTGLAISNSDDYHTIKFNGWYKAVDPENGNFEPTASSTGHMTVKWGRGNEASYTDYRASEVLGAVELPEHFQDKIISNRNSSSSSSSENKIVIKNYRALDARIHTPSQHAQQLVGRLYDEDDKFRHNARFAMRVVITTEELKELKKRLSEIEEKGVFMSYREIDKIDDRPTARCFTPLEVLANILDPQFEFSVNAIRPHDYMQEFAEHFPDHSSQLHFRAYSGNSLDDGSFRERIDPSAKRKTPRRPTIDVRNGYR